MKKPLYIFDLDETLIGGDSSMIWNEYMVKQGLVLDPRFLIEDKRLMGLYSEGKMDMEDYLNFSIAPLASIPTKEVQTLVRQCVKEDIMPTQYVQAKMLIAELAKQQIDMLIISATGTFIVKEVAAEMCIEHALGIDLVIENDHYTSKINGVPTYREGKVERLKRWLAEQSESYSELHFYTDSMNDLPLCQYADVVHLINPSSEFAELGKQAGWNICRWQ